MRIGWILLLGENGRETIIKTHVVLCIGLMMMRMRRHFLQIFFLQLPTAVELRRVWGWMYLILIFLGGTLDLDLGIGISLVEIRDRISGEQRQASIKGSPIPLASKGIWINIIMSVLYSTKIG